MSEQSTRRRCFIACNPDNELQEQLEEWVDRCRQPGMRVVPTKNLHMTLAFLGELSPDEIDLIKNLCNELELPATGLDLDQLGFWRRPGILWAGSREHSAALSEFVMGLRHGLSGIGMAVDARDFAPHITLARRVRQGPDWIPDSLFWGIRDFSLMESQLFSTGVRYTALGHWSASGDVK